MISSCLLSQQEVSSPTRVSAVTAAVANCLCLSTCGISPCVATLCFGVARDQSLQSAVSSHSVRGRRAERGQTATPVRPLLLLQPAPGRELRCPMSSAVMGACRAGCSELGGHVSGADGGTAAAAAAKGWELRDVLPEPRKEPAVQHIANNSSHPFLPTGRNKKNKTVCKEEKNPPCRSLSFALLSPFFLPAGYLPALNTPQVSAPSLALFLPTSTKGDGLLELPFVPLCAASLPSSGAS